MARLLVAALALLAVVAVPAPAHAASVDVTCVGTEVAGYQPGLQLAPRATNVTVNGILSPCTSTTPGLTAGTYLQNFPATLSCATLLDGLSATRVFRWNDGTASTFTYNRTINNVGGQTTVTFLGTITAGRFTGANAFQQVVFVTPNILQCLTSGGLTTLGPGVAILTITTP